ncbi:hypothetical protein GCM10018781_78530 [Kitasatospora indigofera]|uniref:Uncharacterized protein n=1 Tax=Kitasatospora indigofera TaxID=67307 RepID=A0A918YWS1_9ACTN|nr:hypothetical protein [Kitasatospora indigofera]GHE26352.1 hypothetical protein GCM10018781_78530 [Kitasatospora indigofera]
MSSADTSFLLRPAAYLRRHPHSPIPVEDDREVMRRFAVRLGLSAPAVYLDDNIATRERQPRRPQFEALVHALMDGSHRVVLIPGPWVFSGDEYRTRLAHRVLTAAGCLRVMTLPTPLATVWRRRLITPDEDTGQMAGRERRR